MKRTVIIISLLIASYNALSQNELKTKPSMNMKLNAGIITNKIEETKKFYTDILGFGTTFENEFYLLMHTPGHTAQLSFLLPNHPTQQPLFHSAFEGKGVYLTIEVENVDELYEKVKTAGAEIALELRDEPWGDRHFSIVDPNGVGIDLVTYTAPDTQ